MSDKNLCWADLDYWPGTYEEGGNKTYGCDDLVQDCSLGLCPEHCASIHEEKPTSPVRYTSSWTRATP